MPVPANVIGAFADINGTVTTLEWSPDPDKVAAALVQAASDLEDMSAPLRASARVTKFDIQSNFDDQSAPDGEKWIPLNADYKTYKTSIGGNSDILRLWGPLEKAATKFSNFIVDGSQGTLMYNTSTLPYYWRIHQDGTRSSLSVGAAGSIEELLAQTQADESGEISKGRGHNVPARPFIGVSAEAEDTIFNIFDLWVSDEIAIKISSAGVIHRAAGNRFGSVMDIS